MEQDQLLSLVQLASQYVSNIEIHRDTMTVNAKKYYGHDDTGTRKGTKAGASY